MTLQKNLKEAHEYLEHQRRTRLPRPQQVVSIGCHVKPISGTSATQARQRGNHRLAFACSQEQ